MVGFLYGCPTGDRHGRVVVTDSGDTLVDEIVGSTHAPNGVVNLGTMRVDTDLHLVYSQFRHASRFWFPDHDGVGLDPYAEHQLACVLEQFEKITAHQDLAAAEGQEKCSRVREFFQHTLNLARGHLPVIVMVQIAVNTALIAAVRDVEMETSARPVPTPFRSSPASSSCCLGWVVDRIRERAFRCYQDAVL